MNIVDSSAWLEYFGGTEHADKFAKIIENTDKILIPTIIIYEIFKKIIHEKGEKEALAKIAHMLQSSVIDLSLDIALEAANISENLKLPMADSIILASARKFKATIWTLDSDFKDIQGVKYFPKNPDTAP